MARVMGDSLPPAYLPIPDVTSTATHGFATCREAGIGHFQRTTRTGLRRNERALQRTFAPSLQYAAYLLTYLVLTYLLTYYLLSTLPLARGEEQRTKRNSRDAAQARRAAAGAARSPQLSRKRRGARWRTFEPRWPLPRLRLRNQPLRRLRIRGRLMRRTQRGFRPRWSSG